MHNKSRFTVILSTALLVMALLGTLPAMAQPTEVDLSIAKAVDKPNPFDGDTIVYTLTVTNNDLLDGGTGITVADALPAGVTYVSDDGAGAYAGGVWTIGPLAAAGTAVLKITATVDQNTDGQTITDTATVTGAETDPVPANNSASADIAVRIDDLCAKADTLPLPGTSVAVWGYAPGDCTTANPAHLPGPTLVYEQGETVALTLHNGLNAATSITFEGQVLPYDSAGASPLGSKTYNFTASEPGTFLYEAGPLPGAQHQVAMGLYGTLVIRPTGAPGQAYANPATAFTDEAVLVLSEIDPALNSYIDPETSLVDPAKFDMRNFKPKYRLINGKAYPDTEPIATAAGNTLLLRYVNAGQEPHTMALLGAYQKFLSVAGVELPYYRTLTSELLAPGQSADALVAVPPIPAGAPTTVRYPLYDASMRLYNDGGAGFGGMVTFLEVPNGPPGDDSTGPATSALSLTPPKTGGTTPVAVTLSATISDAASGNANVTAAEYFVGATGANGSGCAMTGTFGSPTVTDVSATIPTSGVTAPCVDLATLPHGNHAFYVHGLDAAGNWGSFNFIVLNLDKAGPMTSGIALNPAVSNGSVAVAIQATGNDSMSGGSNVTGADYTVVGSTITGMLIPNQPAPTVSLNGTISAVDMGMLVEGVHTLSIMSHDELGNMGMEATAALLVDQTGPVASGVSVYPDPNNGTLGVNPVTPSVRVDVSLADTAANVAAAEGFINTVGAPGAGFPFTPLDGLFNTGTEGAYAFIPLSTINALPAGTHTIWVRGKDAAGNWGATASDTLTIDKTRPTVSNVATTYASGAVTFDLTATGTDATSNIVAAEWFELPDSGAGKGKPMTGAWGPSPVNVSATIDVVTSGWAAGNHTLYVRVKDAAGNWSLTGSVVVNVVLPDAIFADGFETGLAPPWTSVTGANVSRTAAARRNGSFGMQVAVTGNTPGYVTDGTPVLDANYRARFYFNPNGLTGNNAQEVIFAGLNAANQTIFQVQYRRQNAGGGTYQVRAGTLQNNGANAFTGWFNITNNAFNRIEIQWASANPAQFRLWVGNALEGTPTATLNGLNTSAYKLDAVRLGPSVGLGAGTTGTPYFDDLASTRNTYIGP